MNKIISAALFCLCVAVSAVAQRDYCFHNGGLKLDQNVSFTITGNRIEGTFESGAYDGATSAETFEFTGTRAGRLLTIKFHGKPPYPLPPGTTRIVWTLGSTTLRVPTYGKNYNTGKYSAYLAIYERCGRSTN